MLSLMANQGIVAGCPYSCKNSHRNEHEHEHESIDTYLINK